MAGLGARSQLRMSQAARNGRAAGAQARVS